MVVLAGLTLATPGSATAADRPNVILYMTDDQTLADMWVMPRTRKLFARRGVEFANAYASYPLCCPSRVTFLTGQYAHNHGVWSNEGEDGGYRGFDDSGSLAPTLDAGGYRTGFFGKYLNGYPPGGVLGVVDGWDRWFAKTKNTYFNSRFDLDGEARSFGSRPADYLTRVITRFASRFIRDDSPDPYFAWISQVAPHVERAGRLPPPEARDRYKFTNAIHRTPGTKETDLSDKPDFVQNPRGKTVTQVKRRRHYRWRLRALVSADRSVARIWRTVRAAGQEDNTYLFFVSDNGYLFGEHGLDRKSFLYEESAHIPMYAIGPGFSPGEIVPGVVTNADFAPTVYDATGVAPGRESDGQSLLAAMPSDRAILLENRSSSAVRLGSHVYMEHKSGESELYDLAVDPFQLASMHANDAHTPIREYLAGRLAELRTCAGDECH